MSITHHPAPESLMSCSAGSMPEAFAAVMASHVAMCPACRRELAIMQEIGTVLFADLVPTPVGRDAPVLAMRGQEAGSGTQEPPIMHGDVPPPLVAKLGPSLSRIRWSQIGPGVWHHKIATSNRQRGTLRLIKVDPGRALPAHGHEGSELTLVLSGAFRDETGKYAVGDVADLSAGAEHAPASASNDGCICLVATQGKLRFRSGLMRLLQPLAGF